MERSKALPQDNRVVKIVPMMGRKPSTHDLSVQNEDRCSVKGCTDRGIVVVAGDERETTVMCARHAVAWTRSGACRDIAQHNSGATLASLSGWVTAQA